MTDAVAMFTRIMGTQTAATQEQKLMIDILYNNNIDLQMGDRRLNNITALTWNSGQCANIFSLLEQSLNPEKYPWQTLHKSILLLHTITLFGSEIAIDACINLFRAIDKLQGYNSALVKQGGFFAVGGTDYGAPVRKEARTLVGILQSDDNIRQARQTATSTCGEDTLVPLGEDFQAIGASTEGRANTESLGFGQGISSEGEQTSSLGAGFDLSQVPGMYEDRPDRYFDDRRDARQGCTVGDHQSTREAMNTENLLDLVFDVPPDGQEGPSTSSLPESTDFLPALAKQKELENQLAMQQEQLLQLQRMASQQQQQQQQQQQGQHYFQAHGQQQQGQGQGQQQQQNFNVFNFSSSTMLSGGESGRQNQSLQGQTYYPGMLHQHQQMSQQQYQQPQYQQQQQQNYQQQQHQQRQQYSE